MSESSERIQRIVEPVHDVEAHYRVHAIATYYTDTVKVYLPKWPIKKKMSGMELIQEATKLRKIKKQAKAADSDSSSLRRAMRHFKGYTKINYFDLYVTFTFKKDRYDIEKCRTKMQNWLDNQQERKGRFEYLIVAELHTDKGEGEALHFHGLFKGYQGELVRAISAKTGKQIRSKIGKLVYDIPSYTLGHMNAQKIKNTREDRARVASYVGKYLTKEMPSFPAKKRYWHSLGLAKPETEENPAPWYLSLTPLWKDENEWGKTFYFNRADVEKAKQERLKAA